MISCFILSEAVEVLRNSVLFASIYPSSRGTAVIVAVCASLFAANCALGFVGAYHRLRNTTKFFLFFSFMLLLFQMVCIILIQGSTDQLIVQDKEFKQGWIQVMATIVNDEDADGRYLSFVSDVQDAGQCCGYDSVADPEQNPEAVRCSHDVPCQEFLVALIESQISSLLSTYIVFFAATLVDFVALLLCLVRLVPQPVHHEDPGGYYVV